MTLADENVMTVTCTTYRLAQQQQNLGKWETSQAPMP